MKNLVSHLKSIALSALTFITFVSAMYFSVIFFLILMANESIKGKKNPLLEDDFSSLVQKICDLPEGVFPQEPKKEVDLSGGLS